MLKTALNWLRPKGHFDHGTWELVVFIALGLALALGTTIGVAWAAGFGEVLHRLAHPRPLWIPLALAGQVVAYIGYMLAYREVARVERGPELGMMKLAAVVFTGFGVFVAHGGFSADVIALRGTGISRREARVRVMGLGALEYVLLAPAACVSAIIILAHGSHTAGLGLTLPWAIAVPAGFVAAFWALRYRSKLAQAGGWRGAWDTRSMPSPWSGTCSTPRSSTAMPSSAWRCTGSERSSRCRRRSTRSARRGLRSRR